MVLIRKILLGLVVIQGLAGVAFGALPEESAGLETCQINDCGHADPCRYKSMAAAQKLEEVQVRCKAKKVPVYKSEGDREKLVGYAQICRADEDLQRVVVIDQDKPRLEENTPALAPESIWKNEIVIRRR
ncbi:MAG: hypothetical protein AB1540_12000 [Bdellovibrionota bacterium]